MEKKKSIFQSISDFFINIVKKVKKLWVDLNEKFKKWNCSKKITTKGKTFDIVKMLTCYIGGGTIIIAALIYMYLSDVELKNTVNNLFTGVLLGLAGGIVALLSENLREKPIGYLFLKFLSIGLVVLFVLHIHSYATSETIVNLFDPEMIKVANTIFISNYVLAGVSIALITVNTVVNFILGIEE